MTGVLPPAVLAAAAVLAVGGLGDPGALRLARVRPERRRPPAATTLDRRWLVAAGAVTAVVVAATTGLVLTLLTALGAWLARRTLRSRAAGRRRDAERGAAAEVCATLAAELRSGRSAGEALSVAAGLAHGPSAAVLRQAAAAARLGGDVSAVLAGAGPSAVPEVLRGLAACWQVCARTGSGLATAVDLLADGLRARQAQERALAAELAGPRATASMLSLLPLAGIALAAGLGARPLHLLLHTPLGLACLTAGVALDLAGLLWTRRLVERAVQS